MNTLIGMKHRHDTTTAKRPLGCKPRPVDVTVVETAEYILASNLV